VGNHLGSGFDDQADLGEENDVARGWESKSVESQQDDAAVRRISSSPVSAEDAQRQSERATLMLARNRALADLQHACAAAHRAMLEQALTELDARLASLDAAARQR